MSTGEQAYLLTPDYGEGRRPMRALQGHGVGADEPQIVTMLSKIDSKQDKMDSRIDAFQQLWDDGQKRLTAVESKQAARKERYDEME